MFQLSVDISVAAITVTLKDEHGTQVEKYVSDIDSNSLHGTIQQCSDWWVGCAMGVRATVDKHIELKDEIRNLVLTGSSYGLLLLDESNYPLSGVTVCENPDSRFCFDTLSAFRNENPELLRSCKHILTPKGYLCYMLTQSFINEQNECQKIGLTAEALKAFSLPEAIMGKCCTSDQAFGIIAKETAYLLHIKKGLPIFAYFQNML